MDRLENLTIVRDQHDETVHQEAAGVTLRMGTITCVCGQKRAVVKMYQCLYCGIWFCHVCAEAHFGKTVAEYRKEHPEC